jgi:Flp pilus assembly protein TadG
MVRRSRSESGQAILITVFFMVVLLGATGLTIDVGDWYHEQRQAQATADAAALSGAQDLPLNPAGALTSAQSYADKNGGGVKAGDITLSTDRELNDTITVDTTRTAPGFFSKVFSIDSVNVHASAAARVAVAQSAFGAAPITVSKWHPLLSGPNCPCFDQETTLPLAKDGAPGAFGLLNLDPTANSGVPPLATWLQSGYQGYLPLGPYDSDTGAKFNGNDIRDALTARLGTDLLFPVFDTLSGGGSTAQYNVIGWVAFHLDSFDLNDHGNNQIITGYFERVIWNGIQSATDDHEPDYGVYAVSLVK